MFSNKKRANSVVGLLRTELKAMGHRPFAVRDLMRRLPGKTRASIDMALSRLADSGEVRRVARGVYDQPERDPSLGDLPVDPVKVAEAIARADGIELVPSGTIAANALGMSTQVPARLVFRTTGGSRKIKVGWRTIELRHSTAGRLRARDRTVATIIEALRLLGRFRVKPGDIAQIRRSLSPEQREQIGKAVADAPTWMQSYLRELAQA